MMSLEVLLQAAQYVQEHNRRMASQRLKTPTDQPTNNQVVRGSADSEKAGKKVVPDESGCSGYLAESDSNSSSLSHAQLQDCEPDPPANPVTTSWKDKEKSRRGSTKPTTENRSVHNVLEKNRRAHLKDCFDALKYEVLETDDEKKASHLAVLKSAVRCIRQLQRQAEQQQTDAEKLTREKQTLQQRCHDLKRETVTRNPAFDIGTFLWKIDDDVELDSQATCTAPGSPRPSFNESKIPEPLLANQRQVSVGSSPGQSSSSSEQKYPICSRKRKRSSAGGDSDQSTKSRKPQIKVVTDILQEFRPNSPRITQSSPPSRNSSPRNLPIRLRILQDQQKGMFKNENHTGEASEKITEVETVKTYELPVQHVPMMPGAYWTDGMTTVPFYGASQMFPMTMGQYIMPAGSLGQMLVIPGTGNFPTFFQQQPSSSSSS